MKTRNLVLFDIDGTLVSVERAVSRDAFFAAIHSTFGWSRDEFSIPESYRFHGGTDRSILIDLCSLMGLNAEEVSEVFPHFEENLLQEWDRALTLDNVALLEGAIDTLERIVETNEATLGLLTGNIEPGARSKLRHHDLNRFFSFGAFGSDAIHRNDLPPIALMRANDLNGQIHTFERTVIVGDTHRDIACARRWNIRALAVATGGLTRSELEAHNPDLLVDSLSDHEAIGSFIFDR